MTTTYVMNNNTSLANLDQHAPEASVMDTTHLSTVSGLDELEETPVLGLSLAAWMSKHG